LANKYGVTTTGDQRDDLKALYSKMTGTAIEDIPKDLANDVNKLAEEIAKMKVADDAAEAVEGLRLRMKSLSKEDQKKTAALMSGKATGLTGGQLAEITKKGDAAG
jgi:hypothetical protein